MALVNTFNGSKLVVKLGDGDDPETFAPDCAINTTRGIAFASDVTSAVIPDCDNPDDASWNSVSKDGLSATITGAGMMHVDSTDVWFDWFNSDDAKNAKVTINAAGGKTWTGAWKCTAFEVSGGRRDKAAFTTTLISDGPVTLGDS